MQGQFIVPALIDGPDSVTFSDGILFRLPSELGGSGKLKYYASISALGWSRIDHGYWVFHHNSPELGRVKFLGISPTDAKPSKKLDIVHPFSKKDFEGYVAAMTLREIEFRNRIKSELELLIHDLRRFSNSIYQNAMATRNAIIERDAGEALIRIDNTLAARGMLSIRTDILDITESGADFTDPEPVPVYRRFDKVVKSFQPGSNLRNIKTFIRGNSHSLTFGPDCVEIIAYILIDNALKYSPSNSQITIEARETDNRITVTVTSLGPEIAPDEGLAIFEKGFRSRAARRLDASGTGFGLYLAKTLVNRFGGDIFVDQFGAPIDTDKGRFRDIRFTVHFPIFEKHTKAILTQLESSQHKQPIQEWVKRKRKSRPKKKMVR